MVPAEKRGVGSSEKTVSLCVLQWEGALGQKKG